MRKALDSEKCNGSVNGCKQQECLGFFIKLYQSVLVLHIKVYI
jgi:hypothetical protein